MKRILTFALSLLALTACASAPKYANRAEAIAAQIQDPQSKYVVVACHRGDWRNWPENSIPAIESVIRMGADVVEIDVHMTSDSVLVLCHDRDVKRTTNFSRVYKGQKDKSAKVCDLTFDEIRSLSLKRAHGAAPVDTLRMPTLREALACTKDRICVNIDKGYDYYDQVMAIAEELGVTKQILIKSSKPLSEVAETEARYENNVLYMPIVGTEGKGRALLQSYLDEKVVPLAYELCWGTGTAREVFEDCCARILAQGSKVWVNTLWPSLCGGDGNDDDAAYQAQDPGEVYGYYLKNGVSMIQTDRPALLIGWLKKQGRHSLPR